MNKFLEPIHYNLPKVILSKQKEMIELGMKYGLADTRTITCSQQLDDLLNDHENKKLYKKVV